jgi:hypothetical protein
MANHTTLLRRDPRAASYIRTGPAQIEQMAQQFAGKSEEELMSELVQRVSAQKKRDPYRRSIRPLHETGVSHAQPEQAAKMRAIIDKLKG